MSKFEMVGEVENMWEPLEKYLMPLLGEDEAKKFMFMGAVIQDGVTIYLYKHSWSRDYVNVDMDGYLYNYRCGDKSKCDGNCFTTDDCVSYYVKID